MLQQHVLSAQYHYQCLQFQFVDGFVILVSFNVGTNVVNTAQLAVLGDEGDWQLAARSACLHLTPEGESKLSKLIPLLAPVLCLFNWMIL